MLSLSATRVLLRPMQANEAAELAHAVRSSLGTVGKWMSWASEGYSVAEAEIWIQACHDERTRGESFEFGMFRQSDGCFLGVAGLNQFNLQNRFCNLGYWVRESEQRKGYVSEAISALVPYAFEDLGLNRVEIVVAVGNEASAGVARKAGAVHEGVARKRLMLHGVPTDADMFSFTGAKPSAFVAHGAIR